LTEIRIYLTVFHKMLALAHGFGGIGRSYPAIAIISAWTGAPRLML